MSKRLGSRALLSSFAAVAVIAGIGGVFDAAHAGSIQVQCASPGIEPGSQDPVNGNAIAVSPINISFNSTSYSLLKSQASQSYGNAPGIIPQYYFSNTLVLSTVANPAGTTSCSTDLVLHLTGLNPSETLVDANITNLNATPNQDSTTIQHSRIINGSASLILNISNLVSDAVGGSGSEAVSVTIYNDTNQVLLPETVKLTATLVGHNASGNILNSYDVVKNADFLTISDNASLLFVPSAYVPYNLNGITNAIVASYYTITAPPGIHPRDIDVYILNAKNSGPGGTNIRYCGSSTSLAISTDSSTTNTGQSINQMVLDLSKLVSMCNAVGAGLSNPNQLQSGIPLLFVVHYGTNDQGQPNGSNANSPLNITADGYSLFNYNGQVYIKRLATEIISGNPSVGTTGGSEASYAH